MELRAVHRLPVRHSSALKGGEEGEGHKEEDRGETERLEGEEVRHACSGYSPNEPVPDPGY